MGCDVSSKKENTWRVVLGDCQITNLFQPGEYSKGGEIDGASRNSDGDPNVLYANRNDDGRWLNANWDHPDNNWNDDGAFAFFASANLLISRPALSRG